MELPDISKIKKYSRILNKLGLHEHKIDLREKDHKELLRAFMLSMQRIGDMSLESQVDEEIFNFYDQECLNYAENQGADSDESKEFNRDDVESELYDYDFEEIENYIAENEIEISTDLDADTFDDNQDDIIAEILDLLEAREADQESTEDIPPENEGSSAEAEAKAKLMDLNFKDLKNYIKDNPELKKKFGVIKMADYKSKREAIIDEIIDIEFKVSAALEEENITIGLHEKLFKMDYKAVKAFLKENELNIKIILKNWKNPDEKEKIILEIVGCLSPSETSYDRDTEQEKLENMTCEELQAYAEKNNLIDEITDIDPETFDDEQEDLIDQILDVLDYREEGKAESKPDPKPDLKPDPPKKKKSAKPKVKPTSKRGKKPSNEYSVDGDTNHHCIARAIRDYKGEFSKVEISELAETDRKKLGKASGSVSNFVNIIITAFFVAGVLTPGKKEGYFTFKK